MKFSSSETLIFRLALWGEGKSSYMAVKDRLQNEGAILKVSERGQVSLPRELRGETNLYSAVKREDGVIELHPKFLVDEAQAWYWSHTWQIMEHKAEADIAHGRVDSYESFEEMVRDVEQHAVHVASEDA